MVKSQNNLSDEPVTSVECWLMHRRASVVRPQPAAQATKLDHDHPPTPEAGNQ